MSKISFAIAVAVVAVVGTSLIVKTIRKQKKKDSTDCCFGDCDENEDCDCCIHIDEDVSESDDDKTIHDELTDAVESISIPVTSPDENCAEASNNSINLKKDTPSKDSPDSPAEAETPTETDESSNSSSKKKV